MKKFNLRPWGFWTKSPFTHGFPLTFELVLGTGYRTLLFHYTALRRHFVYYGSVVIGLVFAYGFFTFENPGWKELYDLHRVIAWSIATGVYIGLWRLLCLRITPITLSLKYARFGFLSLFPWNRSFLSAPYFAVEEHPRARGHQQKVREFFNIEDPVLNTYRVYALYQGSKLKVADVYGLAKAEALRDRLIAINDFLNTQIDLNIPIETTR